MLGASIIGLSALFTEGVESRVVASSSVVLKEAKILTAAGF
jgi:hypothetical protein